MRRSFAALLALVIGVFGLTGCENAAADALPEIGATFTPAELAAKAGAAMADVKTIEIVQVSQPEGETDETEMIRRVTVLDLRDPSTPKVRMAGAYQDALEAIIYIGNTQYYSADGTNWSTEESQFPFATSFDESYWSSLLAGSTTWTAVEQQDDDGVPVMLYQDQSITNIGASDGTVLTDIWLAGDGTVHGMLFRHIEDTMMLEQIWYSNYNGEVDIQAPVE